MTPYYQDDSCTIYHGDCAEVLDALGTALADAVLTDPPYNVGKDYGDAHDDAKTDDGHDEWLAKRLELATRGVDGLVFFSGTKNFHRAPLVLPPGFQIHRILGWHRKEFAGDKWVGGPAMCWEPIVWASRAEQPFYNRLFGHMGRDFLVVNSTHGDPLRAVHPCPKPKRVMDWLVGLFVPEGGSVLDPFMGTGTTLRAAKDSGRRAIGIDSNERYCEVAAQRLGQEVLAV